MMDLDKRNNYIYENNEDVIISNDVILGRGKVLGFDTQYNSHGETRRWIVAVESLTFVKGNVQLKTDTTYKYTCRIIPAFNLEPVNPK